jgi:RNAse (barnase) inhibitor barstar
MANTYISKIQGLDFLIAEINTLKCLTQNAMYNEFSEAFGFPVSPNEGSSDVFLDFMRDLAWQKQKNFQVILKNLEKAKKKNPNRVKELIEMLEIVKEHWDRAFESKKCASENNFLLDFEKKQSVI